MRKTSKSRNFISRKGRYSIINDYTDIFNNIQYKYFRSKADKFSTRFDLRDTAIFSIIPIEKYFPGRKTVTETELRQLCDQLNKTKPIQEEDSVESSEIVISETKTVNDGFLKKLLETQEKVENQDISNALKEEIR